VLGPWEETKRSDAQFLSIKSYQSDQLHHPCPLTLPKGPHWSSDSGTRLALSSRTIQCLKKEQGLKRGLTLSLLFFSNPLLAFLLLKLHVSLNPYLIILPTLRHFISRPRLPYPEKRRLTRVQSITAFNRHREAASPQSTSDRSGHRCRQKRIAHCICEIPRSMRHLFTNNRNGSIILHNNKQDPPRIGRLDLIRKDAPHFLRHPTPSTPACSTPTFVSVPPVHYHLTTVCYTNCR
jgi:hypothetical protein